MKRFVTMLLMTAYFVGQLAAMPHAHGVTAEAEPSGHGARPHLHTSWFNHEEHDHDHHAGDHDHEESTSSSAPDAEHDEHDTDAVYLADDARAPLSEKDSISLDDLQLLAALPAMTSPTPPGLSSGAEHWFPDQCRLGCRLYLTLRALRI